MILKLRVFRYDLKPFPTPVYFFLNAFPYSLITISAQMLSSSHHTEPFFNRDFFALLLGIERNRSDTLFNFIEREVAAVHCRSNHLAFGIRLVSPVERAGR